MCVSVCACVQCNNHHISLLMPYLNNGENSYKEETRIEPLGAALELLKYLNRMSYSWDLFPLAVSRAQRVTVDLIQAVG